MYIERDQTGILYIILMRTNNNKSKTQENCIMCFELYACWHHIKGIRILIQLINIGTFAPNFRTTH